MHATLTYPTLPGGRFFTKEGVRGYRFGFNGQMKDDEVYGEGNAYAFEYRIHDARLGRFLSVDPLAHNYPFNSTYAFAQNSVISGGDLEGREHEVKINCGNDADVIKAAIKSINNLELFGALSSFMTSSMCTNMKNGKPEPLTYNFNPHNPALFTLYDNNGFVLYSYNETTATPLEKASWKGAIRNWLQKSEEERNGRANGKNHKANKFWQWLDKHGDLKEVKRLFEIFGGSDYGSGDTKTFEPKEDHGNAPESSGESENNTLGRSVPTTTFPDSINKAISPDGEWVTYDQKTGAPLDTFYTDPDTKGSNNMSTLEFKHSLKKK